MSSRGNPPQLTFIVDILFAIAFLGGGLGITFATKTWGGIPLFIASLIMIILAIYSWRKMHQ